jgi:DNA-binding PadR family transcriptional regulator
MTERQKLTSLSYALLGLVLRKPATGYAIRKIFETTPIGNYSSSQGSIYPALASLVRKGLIETIKGERGKGLFHITDAGKHAFESWLCLPVDPKDLSTAMLRFPFLEGRPTLTAEFLTSFETAALSEKKALQAFIESPAGQSLSRQSQVAVIYGIRNLESAATWAVWARSDRLIGSAASHSKS